MAVRAAEAEVGQRREDPRWGRQI
eukprot:COSAG04_NODE_22511_length_353_cov_1.405512_1_plen_23_part_10